MTTSPSLASQAANASTSRERVRGLDTLRFFLAMWVVFSHLNFVPLQVNEGTLAGKLVALFYGNLFPGQAAVIVFFVISGFCIHYPYRDHVGKLPLLSYFARRHVRIWVPIAVALLIGKRVGVQVSELQTAVLWSLFAEEIYYLIYPGLLAMRNRWGWTPLVVAAYVGAFVVLMSNPRAGDYPSYGTQFNWLLGLPCWLLGCVLAERFDKTAQTKPPRIWLWRGAAWAIGWTCSVLRFHSPVGYPWTLTLFAVFAFFWLQQEITHYRAHAPKPLWENAGKGSYSIYLVHLLGPAIYVFFGLPQMAEIPFWFAKIAFTLALCYVFYALVERPSHLLARSIAKKLTSRVPAPASAREAAATNAAPSLNSS